MGTGVGCVKGTVCAGGEVILRGGLLIGYPSLIFAKMQLITLFVVTKRKIKYNNQYRHTKHERILSLEYYVISDKKF